MNNGHILLLMGGGGTEHEISLNSAKFIEEKLKTITGHSYTKVEITKDNSWRATGNLSCELNFSHHLVFENNSKIKIDCVIPCIHGFPGETGDLQSYLELIGLPYLGCTPGPSSICFNKVTTKLWLNNLDIPNTPFIFLTDHSEESLAKARNFQSKWGQIFIKASNQGSSVGCYPIDSDEDVSLKIREAFKFSSFVLVEKRVQGRELEVSVFEHQGQVHASFPGEVLTPEHFYSYDEKYSTNSKTQTSTKALNLDSQIAQQISNLAKKAFINLKLRHLSRIDFFLEGQSIYLNEINTFPGMTSISLFPKMMEESGVKFSDFLKDSLNSILKK